MLSDRLVPVDDPALSDLWSCPPGEIQALFDSAVQDTGLMLVVGVSSGRWVAGAELEGCCVVTPALRATSSPDSRTSMSQSSKPHVAVASYTSLGPGGFEPLALDNGTLLGGG